jgi:hypothetical protein
MDAAAVMDAAAGMAALQLVPRPEGGHYRETWADPAGTGFTSEPRSGTSMRVRRQS